MCVKLAIVWGDSWEFGGRNFDELTARYLGQIRFQNMFMCLHVLYVIDHDSVFEIVKTSQLHHKCNILFFISAAQFYIAANSKHLKHIFWILDVYCGSAMLTAKLETSFTPYWGQNASPQCSPLFCCLRHMQIIQWDFWPHSYNDPKHIMLVLNQLSFYPEVLTVTDLKIVSCVLTIARMIGRHEAGPSVSPGALKEQAISSSTA